MTQSLQTVRRWYFTQYSAVLIMGNMILPTLIFMDDSHIRIFAEVPIPRVILCAISSIKTSDGTAYHGPLVRYVKLLVAHAPRRPGRFSPPLTSKETASYRSRHASQHVRDARAVMHVGIDNPSKLQRLHHWSLGMDNLIPHLIMDVITYPCQDLS